MANHNSCLQAAVAHSSKTIMTCHGVYPDLEQPAAGANRYVAVSEEVQDHLWHAGFQSTLVRNPIDCARFSSVTAIAPSLRRVLSLCQGEGANLLVEQACRSLGVEFISINGDRMYSPEALMQEVDVVVGLGRTAIEAMACGRAVLVLDSREYSPAFMDGMVTESNLREFARSNFSGRARRITPTLEAVLEELSLYDPAWASRA